MGGATNTRVIIASSPLSSYDDPYLYNCVKSIMIHGSCGVLNPKSPFMQDGKCTKYFPKTFCDRTSHDEDGYPLYKRRDNGAIINKGGVVVDNRFVVPYNPYLLKRFNAHINVEWCNQSRSIKYLFKYVNKGHDRVTAGFYQSSTDNNLSPCEAAWRLFSFDIHYREPFVERLPLHLPDEQIVIFNYDDPIESVLDRPNIQKSKFLAWMEANKKYPETKNLTYAQFPTKIVLKQPLHEWFPRKQRTIDGVVYPTFRDACYAMGLLDDDKQYIDGIRQASDWGTTNYLRNLFAILLFSNQLSRPECQRTLLRNKDLQFDEDHLKNIALAEVENILRSNNKSLADYPIMPRPDMSLLSQVQNRLIHDELRYDRQALAAKHGQLMANLTDEQKNIYDKIMLGIARKHGGLFFIYGYGGTGKTYTWRILSTVVRSKGEIVLTVASSGIEALLIFGGKTSHSRFIIPLDVNEDSTCNIVQDSPLVSLIAKAKLIIWDEAPMTHKHCFEAVDKTFKDILKFSNPNSKKEPFGTRQEVVFANINSSRLWEYCQILTLTKNMRLQSGKSDSEISEVKKFSEWVLSIGDGTIESDDPLASIVNETYPSFLENMDDISYLQHMDILAPTNEIVDVENDYMLSLVPKEMKTYLSFDSTCSANGSIDRPDDIHTPEFLNTVNSSGLPNHELKLKEGVPVMLLRNIDQYSGLCNGTRLSITRLGNRVLEEKILSGTNIRHKVIPFKFQHPQFPITLSFAMKINKSQGQSLQHVGIYLQKPVFSRLNILICDNDGNTSNSTTNVVYKEVFQNLS
ncbi:hypothetical protein ACP275_08G219500 [Erythranthe tilingii]